MNYKNLSRKDIYTIIVENSLQDVIKITFGKNYTNVSTAELKSVLEDFEPKTEKSDTCAPLKKLVEILKKKHLLLKSEVKDILG